MYVQHHIMPNIPPPRTYARRDKKDDRLTVTLSVAQKKALQKRALDEGAVLSDLVREGIENILNPPEPPPPDPEKHWSDEGTDQFRAPVLNALPCGPWKEGIADARTAVFSRDVVDYLEARESDIFASTSGDSMEGAGILEGDLVMLRPLDGKAPRRGEIVMVNITTEDGEQKSTLKRYNGADASGKPRLLNGADEDYPLPDDATAVRVEFRAVARIGRL